MYYWYGSEDDTSEFAGIDISITGNSIYSAASPSARYFDGIDPPADNAPISDAPADASEDPPAIYEYTADYSAFTRVPSGIRVNMPRLRRSTLNIASNSVASEAAAWQHDIEAYSLEVLIHDATNVSLGIASNTLVMNTPPPNASYATDALTVPKPSAFISTRNWNRTGVESPDVESPGSGRGPDNRR